MGGCYIECLNLHWMFDAGLLKLCFYKFTKLYDKLYGSLYVRLYDMYSGRMLM